MYIVGVSVSRLAMKLKTTAQINSVLNSRSMCSSELCWADAGLFLIEAEAVESGTIYNPYSGELMDEADEC